VESIALMELTSVAGTPVERMEAQKLDEYIRNRVPECSRRQKHFQEGVKELLAALVEMERRYEKKPGARTDLHTLTQPTWHGYLLSVGINPSTFRSWKQRSASERQLYALVDTPQPPKSRAVTAGRVTIPETQAALMARAGVKLTNTILNPLLSKQERDEVSIALAGEIRAAIEGGDFDPPPQTDDGDTETIRHAIAPALIRLTTHTPDDGSNNTIIVQAAMRAANVAATDVTEADIRARMYPVLSIGSRFGGLKETKEFGRMHNMEVQEGNGGVSGSLTTYARLTSSPFFTFEQAWAYAEAFCRALPEGIDYEFGVAIKGGRWMRVLDAHMRNWGQRVTV